MLEIEEPPYGCEALLKQICSIFQLDVEKFMIVHRLQVINGAEIHYAVPQVVMR